MSAAAVIPAPRDRVVFELAWWADLECNSLLEYLAGYVDGDGLLYFDPRRGYELKVTDRECLQIDYLSEIIRKCFNTARYSVYRGSRYCYLRLYRKNVVTGIQSLIDRLRENPTAYYVSGLFDAEGDCTPSKVRVRFTNSRIELIEAVPKYLDVCGVKYHIYLRKKERHTWYSLEIYGVKQVARLLDCLDLKHPKWSACRPTGTPGAYGRGAYWA